MKHEIKALWADALESGSYEQAFDYLRVRKENGTYAHCVMGVLINIYCTQNGKQWNEASPHSNEWSEEFAEWAGFESDHNHFLFINGVTAWPHIHNDHFKVIFPELLKAIREQL